MMAAQLNTALIHKLCGSLMCLAYFLTPHLGFTATKSIFFVCKFNCHKFLKFLEKDIDDFLPMFHLTY